MSKFAIRTEKLGKRYFLGALSEQTHNGYDVLGFSLPMRRLWPVLFNDRSMDKENKNAFWALRDLDLEVRPGELVGVVGRNGSGKSTLLKILARVTEPTTGFADVTGQVGSLLEVGTGFHPELTGRQNVYLNGSIMGMTSEQIDKRFDQIVAFAEVEQFIDTPVKHYSSGMYMRLAFSVSAHMQCDILIVDEVLAVGDFQFQKKCLGRIESEVKSGKTVLFVSHNTSMIMQVCTRCILFEQGRLVEDGLPQTIVESYLSPTTPLMTHRGYSGFDVTLASPERYFYLWGFMLTDINGNHKTHFDVKEPIVVHMEWGVLIEKYELDVHISLRHETGVAVFTSMDNLDSPWHDRIAPVGRYRVQCVIPPHFLNDGVFMIDFVISARKNPVECLSVVDVVTFRVVDDMKNEGVRGDWDRPWPSSILRPFIGWTFSKPEDSSVTEHERSTFNQ
jgi:lipopolysaccharide transport system ATP-binding protein